GWIDFHEVWKYRDLIWIFALRDITVRYRQTMVGVAWTVLQPLSLMIVLVLFQKMVISQAAIVPPEPQHLAAPEAARSIPNSVNTLCGLILYQLFAAIISTSTNCLVDNRQMLTKVYFPRIVLPLAASLRPLLDFGIALLLLIVMMLWFRVAPGFGIVLAPGIV